MSSFVAALPMYDWPEVRAETDAQWAAIRERLVAAGIDAPATLARRNADLPAVPGGIRDAHGAVIAPDPATLPPDEFDFATLWRHPALLFGQTCWGPMQETGLSMEVAVVGQPDYAPYEGGRGTSYSSALLMRRGAASAQGKRGAPHPADGRPALPVEILKGRRLAFNEPHSMSGMLALRQDLEGAGQDIGVFSALVETGAHRLSIRAVAEGRADIAAIDCRTWSLAQRFEPVAREVAVVGWTGLRPGLPYISSRVLADLHETIRNAIQDRPDARVLRRKLIEGGIASPDEIRGCTQAEIRQIEDRYGPLPDAYKDILRLIGHGAGRLVDRMEFWIYSDRLDEVNRHGRSAMQDFEADGVSLPETGPVFFISARQGDYPTFIPAGEGSDAAVFMMNGDRNTVERIHDSVWDWIMEFVRDAEYFIGKGLR